MAKQVTRLYKYFRPENYKLDLIPNRDKLTFSGKVVISGKKTGPPSRRLTFHQKGLKITGAKITRIDKKGDQEFSVSRINYHQKFDEVRLHTKETLQGGTYQIELEFSGKITEPMHGIYPSYFAEGSKKLIATQLESHHARELFPSIDEPEAKATFDLSLITPPGETVLGNTPIKQQKTKGKMQITSFEPTPRMSTYLLAFVYGDLVYKEAKTKSGVVVRSHATPANKNSLDFSVTLGVRVIDFFEDYFGVSYPLPKLDMVALPDFSAGAMENWGLVTYRESLLLADPKSSSIETKQSIALVVAHELSHQWFGNLVTMQWWDDLWLNESFANLMEYVAVDALFPEWKVWEQFINLEMNMAQRRDSLPGVQAVRTKVNHPDELGSLFDPAIVYAKGGNILNMLRHMIGEDSFRRGLNIYFDKHKYGSTQDSDLWEALSGPAKMDINGFMQKWLKRPGFPVITVDHEPGTKNFNAYQDRLIIGESGSDDTMWPVPLAPSADTEDDLLSSKSGDFWLNSAAEPLVLNNEARSYFVPRYKSKAHFDSIMRSIKEGRLSPINRLQLLQNYSLLDKAGTVNTTDNLELLSAYAGEAEEAVWGAMAGILADAMRLVAGDKKAETDLHRFTAELVSPMIDKLGWDGNASDSSQTLRLRDMVLGLGASAEIPKVLEEARRRFKKLHKPVDVSADIRGTIYYAAAKFGSPADFKRLLDLHKSTENSEDRNEIAAALTSTKDQKQIDQLLAMMTTPEVRLQDMTSWFVWLLRNFEARASAWKWLVNNWGWIEEKFGSDKNYDSFPRYAANIFSRSDELAKYKKFFGPKSKQTALERVINIGIPEIQSRVDWRCRNEAAVKKWLSGSVEG